MIPRTAQQIADVQEALNAGLPALGVDGTETQNALERAKAELEALERRVLEKLGLPRDYVRTARLRLDRELISWKLQVSNALAAGIFLVGLILLPLFEFKQYINEFKFFILSLLIFLGIAAPHEALHALSFWLFGRKRPGFKLEFGSFGLGFYTACHCLLRRQEYLIVVLLPFFGITALGIWLWILMPQFDALWYLLIGMNVAEAVGDLWIVKLLLQASPQALCLDTSYEIAIFEPASEARQPTTATKATSAPRSEWPTR